MVRAEGTSTVAMASRQIVRARSMSPFSQHASAKVNVASIVNSSVSPFAVRQMSVAPSISPIAGSNSRSRRISPARAIAHEASFG
jgi:hypothetical protein